MKPKRNLFFVAAIAVGATALVSAQRQGPPHGPAGGGIGMPAGVGVRQLVPKKQQPGSTNPTTFGVVHLTTNLGSFKINKAGIDPAIGTLEMSFKGTVLIDGLQSGGTVTPSGNVRLEFTLPKYKKAVYFGSGKLVIKGKADAIQFFGQNLDGTFTGKGIILLYGDFDKNLETGYYWYGNDSKNKKDWGTGGMTITTKPPQSEQQQVIKVKNVTGKG